MTRPDQRKLLREVARLCEKAYRRGFQQGHLAGVAGKAAEAEVSDWRYDRKHRGVATGYDKAVPPPGTHGMPPAMRGVLYRLWVELDGHEAIKAMVEASGLDVETGKAT